MTILEAKELKPGALVSVGMGDGGRMLMRFRKLVEVKSFGKMTLGQAMRFDFDDRKAKVTTEAVCESIDTGRPTTVNLRRVQRSHWKESDLK